MVNIASFLKFYLHEKFISYYAWLILKLIILDNLHSEDEDFADSSTDDEKDWAKEVRKQYKIVKENKKQQEYEEEMKQKLENEDDKVRKEPKLYELKDNVSFVKSRYMRNRAK